MKKILFLLLLIFIACTTNYAQDTTGEAANHRKCGTMEYMEKQKALDPSLELQLQQIEEYTRQWIKENPKGFNDKTVITIPVVVHVVFSNVTQNLSDARIQEQINCLNRDYSGANTHTMGAFSTSLKANTELQFCLAKKTPTGGITNGIERSQTSVSQFVDDNKVKHNSQGGLDQWDPYRFMNIWVCNLGGGMCGYAAFPSSTLDSNYGVVIHYKYFGVTGASYPYNNGGTTSHEIGHCFNLYHIWGDDGGTCDGSDYCDDTPNQADATFGIHTGVLTDACSPNSPGIMYMNFLDYSDDLVYANFTPDQKARIQALFSANGLLHSLAISDAAGCLPNNVIEKTENINDISIYPNPAQDKVNVMFNLTNSDNITITISNIVGDIITKIEKQKVSSIDIPIDLSGQSQGIYFVRIQSGMQIVVRKISLLQ